MAASPPEVLLDGDLLPEVLRCTVCSQTLATVPAVCRAWREAWPDILAAFPVMRPHGQLHRDIFTSRLDHTAASAPTWLCPVSIISLPDGRMGVLDDDEHLTLISPSGALTQAAGFRIDNSVDFLAWAQNDTSLFVTFNNFEIRGVMKFNLPELGYVETLTLDPDEIALGTCVAAAATANQLFLTANYVNRVFVVNLAAQGGMEVQTSFGEDWLVEPAGIAVHEGMVIIADCCACASADNDDPHHYGTPCLHVCSPAGTRLRTITGFFNPCDLAIAGGRLYVSNLPPRPRQGQPTPEERQAARRVHALALPSLEPAPFVDDMLANAVGLKMPGCGRRWHGSLFVHGNLLCTVTRMSGVFAFQLPDAARAGSELE